MYKLGIIGIGTIGGLYQQALQALPQLFSVTAVCDLNLPEEAPLSSAARYRDYRQMLQRADLDCVVISTPIDSHISIARDCLEAGIPVLLEKPAALDPAQIGELYLLAERKRLVFHVGFHAAFGLDLLWYLEHQQDLDARCRVDRVAKIRCLFADPYMEKGQIDPRKLHLGGSYVDSGINALSVCARLLPGKTFRITGHRVQQTESNTVYHSLTELDCKDTSITIETAWDLGRSHKSTLLDFPDATGQILLDHTAQQVVRIFPNGSREILFQGDPENRLPSQYVGVFREFADLLQGGAPSHSRRQVLHIHELLSPEHPIAATQISTDI